jgi:hypothetical protein
MLDFPYDDALAARFLRRIASRADNTGIPRLPQQT